MYALIQCATNYNEDFAFWERDFSALLTSLHQTKVWWITFCIAKYLILHKVDKSPKLDKNYKLSLICSWRSEIFNSGKLAHHNFFNSVKDLKLPVIKKLKIMDMKCLDEPEIEHANMFFKNFDQKNLRILYLHSGLLSKLERFKEGLSNLLNSVETQIFISKFIISEEWLKIILEQSSTCKELVLYSWLIEDLSTNFKLDFKNKECGMESLDSFRTFHNLENDELDIDNLTIWINAMSQTCLAKSLKKFHMLKGNFEAKDVHDIFKDFGLEMEVLWDWRAPLVLK